MTRFSFMRAALALAGAAFSFAAVAAALALAGAAFSFAAVADEITLLDLHDLPKADIYVLGEVHDNPTHHMAQAAAILVIEPKAVVFEMLSDGKARTIPSELPAETVLGRLLEWDSSGWPDFAIYFPIFAAAEGANFYGAEAPKDDVRAAFDAGAASVFGDSASLFGLDRALDDRDQSAREELQATAHCGALPATLLPGMVEAQRLRDAYLARAAMAALLETGGPVAVITGNGHARKDWGLPRLLRAADAELDVFALGQFEATPKAAQPFDQWIVTDPVERGDPCDAFKD